MPDVPFGRRRRPPKYIDSFSAPIYKETPLIPKGFEQMESRFYDHARKALRRTRVVKVFK